MGVPDLLKLDGKVALVTGAGSRIGRAYAEALARPGRGHPKDSKASAPSRRMSASVTRRWFAAYDADPSTGPGCAGSWTLPSPSFCSSPMLSSRAASTCAGCGSCRWNGWSGRSRAPENATTARRSRPP